MEFQQCVEKDEDQAIRNIGQTSSHVKNGCKTWKMNEGDAKKIDVFQNPCLRRIINIKWQDEISNRELLERANVERLCEEVRRRRWRFSGHILRQQPEDRRRCIVHTGIQRNPIYPVQCVTSDLHPFYSTFLAMNIMKL